MSQSKHANLKTVRMAAYLMILVITLSAFTVVPTVPIQTEHAIAPESKIDDTLLMETNLEKQQDVLISYNKEATEFKAQNAVALADSAAEFIDTFPELNMIHVKMVTSAITDVAKQEFIERIWSNEPREVTSLSAPVEEPTIDDDYISPVDTIGARDLWEQGYNGSGIVIAVLDTGVDIMSPDLTVNAFASFVEGDSLPLDT
ncbi:MAG: hypothetical protein RTU30_02850, partial [Candidatus Thorarchaeota archaeon]